MWANLSINQPKVKFVFTRGTVFNLFSGHTDHVICLTALDHNYVASGALDGGLIVWDVEQGKIKYKLDKSKNGHTSSVTFLLQLENGYLGKF